MTRVQARAALLSIALQHAIEVGLHRQGPRDTAIHEARELRREVRRATA